MLYTAQRLLDKVRYWALDKTAALQASRFTDAEVLDALNEAQHVLVGKVLLASEDYFGVYKDIALSAGVSQYPLYDGFLILRKVDLIDQNSEIGDVTESRMAEGVAGLGAGSAGAESEYNYALYGDDLHLTPTVGAGVTGTLREWYIRDPGPILLDGPNLSFPTADTIVFGSQDAPVENDIMVGTLVQVVSGTGARQRRKITAWDGPNAKATVDTPFSPVLGATSKVGTISRLPRLFHDLLVYGAAARLLAANQEDPAGPVGFYNEQMDTFEDFIEQARTYSQRSPAIFDPDDGN